jgi:DNA-binding FadR family transcriptional regulator
VITARATESIARFRERLRRVNIEHESIYNAISGQDADAARAAMRTHLSNSRERLRKVKDTSAALAIEKPLAAGLANVATNATRD